MDIDCRACNYRGNLDKCAERINNFAEGCHSGSINSRGNINKDLYTKRNNNLYSNISKDLYSKRNKDLDDKARKVREEIIKRDYDILKALGDES